jgi:hypothetical protein
MLALDKVYIMSLMVLSHQRKRWDHIHALSIMHFANFPTVYGGHFVLEIMAVAPTAL